jgi:two-component system response regulator AtoC
MKDVREKLEKLARTNIPILICGEPGTGKKIIAWLIHRKSQCSWGKFVEVRCSEMPQTPFEEWLFGDVRGSLGNESRPHMMEFGANGTLFLDEVGDLSSTLQTKLLRKFQEGRFGSMHGYGLAPGDARIVCATNLNLELATENGSFRPDLFYRINVGRLDLPPLRERGADIPTLVQYFLTRFSGEFNCMVKPISPATMRSLEDHSWPGNIRELENLIKRYVILGVESTISDGLTTSSAGAATHQQGPWLTQNHKTGLAGARDYVNPPVVERVPRFPVKSIKGSS